MEIAVSITQLLIVSGLIVVIAGAGAPPRDGREAPTAREELDDFVYRSRRLGSRLKLWWKQRNGRKKRPPSL